MGHGTLVLDVETRLLAAEVAGRHAGELAGASPWTRPDLFGFAGGVAVDAETGEARRYGPDEAGRMIRTLAGAAQTVSYNGAAFDLGVLSAYGDVSGIRADHVDLRELVAAALERLARDGERLRTGGLDALAWANGIGQKTGSGTDAPALYRAGRIEELLDYCEADARLTARLYEAASTGGLRVKPHAIRDGERVAQDPDEIDLRAALSRGDAGSAEGTRP